MIEPASSALLKVTVPPVVSVTTLIASPLFAVPLPDTFAYVPVLSNTIALPPVVRMSTVFAVEPCVVMSFTRNPASELTKMFPPVAVRFSIPPTDAAPPVAAPSANRFGRISPTQAAHVVDEFQDAGEGLDEVWVLDGGTAAWVAAGLPVESGETHLASDRIDRYRRPYEGTNAPRAAIQGYLDWEFGLVAQLGRDGTHGFRVI